MIHVANLLWATSINRTGNVYKIVCGVTPQLKCTSQNFKVKVVVDIGKVKILSAKNFDCVASSGGCKHSLAFLG